MPRSKNSTVDVNLELDFDSDEFESLLFGKSDITYILYKGSQEQLSKAGIPVTLFPGQPGRQKTISRFTINGGASILTCLYGKSKPVRYQLIWYIPEHLRAIADPGHEVAMKASTASPARFKVGDVCICRKPDYMDDGEKLEITGAFEFRCVLNSAGMFINKDGERFDYRWGYTAREIGGSPYFYPAHELLDIDHSIRHIRLVGAVPADDKENRHAAA